MMRVYATQIDNSHYEIQVGRVLWQGEGQWSQIPLPERQEIVRLLMATELTLTIAIEDSAEVYGVQSH